jgi:hypothetical protein
VNLPRILTAVTLLTAATVAWTTAPRAGNPHPYARASVIVTDSFPHARHARLFTTCESCHEGIAQADWQRHFPDTAICAGCHNGDIVRRVDWAPRPPRPTLVHFSHSEHPEIPCASCHAANDTLEFMQVGRAFPERCVMCHGGDAPSHLAQTECTPCHAALPEARGLAAADIARFPKPPSHDSSWVLTHKQQAGGATCQVCHAREWCASCHANADAVAPIRALPSDARVATVARGRRPKYPEPATHLAAEWANTHGAVARTGTAYCANCHTRESCYACHLEPGRVEVVAQLPRRVRNGAPGVNLAGRRPADHVAGFARNHRTAASGGDQRCSRCHTPRFCATCHDGAASPSFHGSDFVRRHSQAAYNQEAECASCHQPQAFCVACHRQTGMSQPNAPRDAAFHTAAGGAWLFGHSAVARRSIETCATCHEQTFCLQCHSARGGWRVNPHGPGFDPSMGDKNPAMCRVCHLNGPPSQ